MNLDRLRFFYYAAKSKSFTHSELNMSASALSRQISTLEHEIKTQLFHRYPRKLELTDKGKQLYDLVSNVLIDLETMKKRLRDVDTEPSGFLSVTSPAGWASNLMLKFIPYYLKKYPKIHLSMESEDKNPNFKEGGTDIAIFPFIPDNSHIKHKHLKKFRVKLYASSEYLKKHGMPKTPRDLDNHQLISYNPKFQAFKGLDWHLTLGRSPDEPKRDPYLITNNLFQAVSQGLGIASLAVENPYRSKDDCVNILPEYEGPNMNIYAIYPEHLEPSIRVQSFIKELSEQINLIFVEEDKKHYTRSN